MGRDGGRAPQAASTLAVLADQHRALLARLAGVEGTFGGSDAEYHLLELAVHLDCEAAYHLSVEEDALFPILARHCGIAHGPLALMHADHARFRAALWRLGAAVQARNVRAQRARAATLIAVLRAHISKGERVLFPLAASLLSRSERGEMGARAACLGT